MPLNGIGVWILTGIFMEKIDKTKEMLAFISSSVHDMKAPLTTIGGFIEAVLDGTAKDGSARHCLETVLSETNRLTDIVNELLDVSKIEAGAVNYDMRPTDICECVRKIIISLEGKINAKNLDIEFACTRDRIKANADEPSLTRALYNICENAVKFSPAGGKISVFVSETENGAKISVTNEGEPIDKADIGHIFEPFYRSKRKEKISGSGLGLYIAMQTAKAHGGVITVTSEECGERESECACGKTEFVFEIRNGGTK